MSFLRLNNCSWTVLRVHCFLQSMLVYKLPFTVVCFVFFFNFSVKLPLVAQGLVYTFYVP